jgi:hypothetical protein
MFICESYLESVKLLEFGIDQLIHDNDNIKAIWIFTWF